MLTGTRSARIYSAAAIGMVAALLACHKAVPPDAVCGYEALTAGAQVASGQGAIQALAPTNDYFAVRDSTGKQIANAHVNASASVPAGDYVVVLNNSTHATSAQSGMLTKCIAGTILVNGKTDEYYAVLDKTFQQLASAHVAAALSLFPGNYTVRLNNSDVAAEVQPRAMVELKPGTVNINVGTDEYYAVLDAANRQLTSSHVGRAVGLFAGGYTVRINNSDAHADVHAGESLNVPAGTLAVHGTTDEYYAVLNNAGTQLASAHLEKPIALVPGTYNVKVNNSTTPVTIVDGVTAEIKTGTVLVQGSTDEYYAILDAAGTQLASAHLGRGLALMPGTYHAKLNNAGLTIQVDAGRVGEYQSGSLMVKTSGTDYYTVLDTAGTQLASKQVNQAVSLPAGKYSVKFANNVRPATVTAGQNSVLNW